MPVQGIDPKNAKIALDAMKIERERTEYALMEAGEALEKAKSALQYAELNANRVSRVIMELEMIV